MFYSGKPKGTLALKPKQWTRIASFIPKLPGDDITCEMYANIDGPPGTEVIARMVRTWFKADGTIDYEKDDTTAYNSYIIPPSGRLYVSHSWSVGNKAGMKVRCELKAYKACTVNTRYTKGRGF